MKHRRWLRPLHRRYRPLMRVSGLAVAALIAGTGVVAGGADGALAEGVTQVVPVEKCRQLEGIVGAWTGQCIHGSDGAHRWLGSRKDPATGRIFICIDHGRLPTQGAASISAGEGLKNQVGWVVPDPEVRALGYLMSKYAPEGTSGDAVTDAGLNVVAREVMNDGFVTNFGNTLGSPIVDASWGLPPETLAKARTLWVDAQQHIGPYRLVNSGLPQHMVYGTTATVTTTLTTSPDAVGGAHPLAGIAATAIPSNQNLTVVTSTNGGVSDADGQVTWTVKVTGPSAGSPPSNDSVTFSVASLPNAYPLIATPDGWDYGEVGLAGRQRGLVAPQRSPIQSTASTVTNHALPSVSTTASSASAGDPMTPVDTAAPGDLAFDKVAITNNDPDWQGGWAQGTLYGPYSTEPTVNDCRAQDPSVGMTSMFVNAQGVAVFQSAQGLAYPAGKVGYYTWQWAFPDQTTPSPSEAPVGSWAFTTPCGEASETVKVQATPRLGTVASAQVALAGTPIFDNVMIKDSAGQPLSGDFKLLGPVAPRPDGTCDGVDWAHAAVAVSGTFSTTGDGVYKVGDYTPKAVGCFTYTERLSPTTFTNAVAWTEPGIVAETVLATSPSLTTTVSSQHVTLGDAMSDTVVATGTAGHTIQGQFRVLGPLAPASDGTCHGLVWEDETGTLVAPIAASGDFTVIGDEPVTGVGTYLPKAVGCYTYSEQLLGDFPTANTWTAPGDVAETALVTNPPPVTTPAVPTGGVGQASSEHGVSPVWGGALGGIGAAGLFGAGLVIRRRIGLA